MPETIPPLQPLQQQNHHLTPTLRHTIKEQHVRVFLLHLPQFRQTFRHVRHCHQQQGISRRRGTVRLLVPQDAPLQQEGAACGGEDEERQQEIGDAETTPHLEEVRSLGLLLLRRVREIKSER